MTVGAFKAPYQQEDNGGQYAESFGIKNVIEHPERYDEEVATYYDFVLLHLDSASTIEPVQLDSSGLSDSFVDGKTLIFFSCLYSHKVVLDW